MSVFMDQYGNLDLNKDGVIDFRDNIDADGDGRITRLDMDHPNTQYQTDVLYSPVGEGAAGIQRNDSWVQNAFNTDGTLKKGDWAGDINDTNNAMDDLLKSDKFNNGRVPDVSMVENVTKTADGDIVILNDNKQTGVKGIVEETELSNIFLSDMNTKVIQDTLRYKVYKQTKMVVDYQSSQELFIVMRSVLLQHANFKIAQKNLVKEIKRLNKLVVDYASHEVSSNVKQFNVYINDIQNLPEPNARPGFSDSGSRNRSQDMSAHIAI